MGNGRLSYADRAKFRFTLNQNKTLTGVFRHIWSAPRCKREITFGIYGPPRDAREKSRLAEEKVAVIYPALCRGTGARSSCPDGMRAHPRPYQPRSVGSAGSCLNQVFGNAERVSQAITSSSRFATRGGGYVLHQGDPKVARGWTVARWSTGAGPQSDLDEGPLRRIVRWAGRQHRIGDPGDQVTEFIG